MLRNILGLRDLNASDVMIPRADIVSVGMSELSEIIAQVTAANHSVFGPPRTLDDIAGIIHIEMCSRIFTRAGRGCQHPAAACAVRRAIRLLDLLQDAPSPESISPLWSTSSAGSTA